MDGHQAISHDSVTVLVASPPSLVRYGLRSVLQNFRPGWAVSEADTLDMTIEVLGHYTPDIVLLDVGLPGVDNVNVVRLIAEHMSEARILVLADGGHRGEILHWIDSGAQGYLSKSAAGTQVVCAIDTLLSGGIFVPATLSVRPDHAPASAPRFMPQQASRVTTPYASHAAPPTATAVAASTARSVDLTDRQRAVLELVLEGYNTKMIARNLNIAVATAKVHLAAIYRMLGAHNRSEVIVKATRDYTAPRHPPVEEKKPAPAAGTVTWTVHENRAAARKPEAGPRTRRIDALLKKTIVSADALPTASAV